MTGTIPPEVRAYIRRSGATFRTLATHFGLTVEQVAAIKLSEIVDVDILGQLGKDVGNDDSR